MTNIKQVLQKGIHTLMLSASAEQIEQWEHYIALLCKWNRAYNLTAIKTPLQMASHHVLDSLSIASYITGSKVLDMGSGGGAPGIPLAIYFPHKSFVVLDSQSKKTAFLHHVVLKLGLKNIEVINDRVEHFEDSQGFDCITVRAFGILLSIVDSCKHLCHKNTHILAMKGVYPQEELTTLAKQQSVEATVHALTAVTRCFKNKNTSRHLVVLQVYE